MSPCGYRVRRYTDNGMLSTVFSPNLHEAFNWIKVWRKEPMTTRITLVKKELGK